MRSYPAHACTPHPGADPMNISLRVVGTLSAFAIFTSTAVAQGEWDAVAKAIGRPGTEASGGVYRVGIPRSDLTVTLDAVQIKPGLALGADLAVKKTGNEGVVMGDLVLLQEDVTRGM